MNPVALAQLIERLPPGRARARYERLLSRGEVLPVRMPYSDSPLWLVSDLPLARVLMERGVPRWRIWTLSEAQGFLAACGSKVHTLAEAARAFQGESL